MIFEISRTSVWDEHTKPHEAAFKKAMPVYDLRTCTEDEYNARIRISSVGEFNKPWREYGTEHTVNERGDIKRRVRDAEQWVIQIESLEELLQFAGKSEIIVSGGDAPYIEIYDDYRE